MSYLTYVNGLGPNYKGDNLYEFIFSDSLDVWGESWESKPSNGYPTPPELQYIKKVGVLRNTNLKLELIQDSDFFSMEDAMDDIIALAWEIENEVDYGDSYSEDEDVTDNQVHEPEDVYTSDKTYTDDDLSDEKIENLLGWDNLRKSLLHISCFKEAFDSMRLQGLSIEENYLVKI